LWYGSSVEEGKEGQGTAAGRRLVCLVKERSRAAVWTDKERLEEKEDGHVHFRVYRGVNMDLYRMKM
jgi:hypothetical protein